MPPRRYDHDQAFSEWQGGATLSVLARRYGVSFQSIQRLVKSRTDPDWVENRKQAFRKNNTQPCAEGCGKMLWMHTKTATGTCRACARRARLVRKTTLLCTHCEQWKRYSEFGRAADPVRHDRRSWCKACETALRREERERSKDPCPFCGAPKLQESRTCRKCHRRGRESTRPRSG